ncbi:MAG TPA: intradiol ring-cleavage dioxygenase [Burkholderiaceae bacterium]|nr:intradiol ring-cleavage dioxygenase [Burkholderiaceae bacterium]
MSRIDESLPSAEMQSAAAGAQRGRRALLGLFGATAASALWGRDVAAQARDAPAEVCVVRPRQTEGPYFIDEQLERADIRSDPTTGSVAAGVPLRIAFQVSRLEANACVPLAGAIVDVWQCNAEGVYAGVRDFAGHFDASGRKFLRGYQKTNSGGVAEFLTIYPGWYPGRTVHIHFKVRTALARDAKEFTSQLYFDDALSDQVFTRAPYAGRGRRAVTNANDGLYRRGGDQLRLALSPQGDGYAGTFALALQLG